MTLRIGAVILAEDRAGTWIDRVAQLLISRGFALARVRQFKAVPLLLISRGATALFVDADTLTRADLPILERCLRLSPDLRLVIVRPGADAGPPSSRVPNATLLAWPSDDEAVIQVARGSAA